jgi:hypothetical protein
MVRLLITLSKYDKYISEMNLIKAMSFFEKEEYMSDREAPKLRNVGGLNPR